MNLYLTIWKYKVKRDKISEFEKLYGNKGEWVKLFKKYPGYIKTDLIKDISNKNIYITLDYWKSEKDYRKFKEKTVNEYSAIDLIGDDLTESEEYLGEFITHKI